MKRAKLLQQWITVIALITFGFGLFSTLSSQTQRNPVLEYCTGTWCQWCPCGHEMIRDSVLTNIPNAIIIGYHGPANGSDPFSFFPGNTIISSLGYTGYPTGIVDRTTGTISRGVWYSNVNARASVPATVDIDLVRSYNAVTREFNAIIDFTALQNLSGQFKYNAILLEDGLVYGQTTNNTCSPGFTFLPNYVHAHVVRSMMNGALGEEVINGTWNQGQTININLNYIIPSNINITPDSCHVVLLVYEVGSPLSSNGDIQQAKEWTLISPNFVATMASQSPDIIASNTTVGQYEAVIYNEGLMADKYYFSLTLDAPASWGCDFTTPNGTFPAGGIDSVDVIPGDSVTVSVSMNPNSNDGYGQAILEFLSANNAGVSDSKTFRFVTETGFKGLVIDATEGKYADSLTASLDKFIPAEYGLVSRSALHMANVMVDNFDMMFWSAGKGVPAFYQDEVTALQNYLDGGGTLFITGQDIGFDIFDPSGFSQFAQSFYNIYLHADYVANASNFFIVNGYAGDPITDGIQFIISDIYTRSADKIAPYDAEATSILKYYNGPDVAGIRVETANYRVVYLAVGFEQIDDPVDRDSILVRSIRWFEESVVGIGEDDLQLLTFELAQNYPNPFNPETVIKYSLDNHNAAQTTLIIYNALGQVVRRLVDEPQTAGNYEVTWNARDNFGNPVASGIYYYQLKNAQNSSVQKMVLVR